jgi:hypothetical protein
MEIVENPMRKIFTDTSMREGYLFRCLKGIFFGLSYSDGSRGERNPFLAGIDPLLPGFRVFYEVPGCPEDLSGFLARGFGVL